MFHCLRRISITHTRRVSLIRRLRPVHQCISHTWGEPANRSPCSQPVRPLFRCHPSLLPAKTRATIPSSFEINLVACVVTIGRRPAFHEAQREYAYKTRVEKKGEEGKREEGGREIARERERKMERGNDEKKTEGTKHPIDLVSFYGPRSLAFHPNDREKLASTLVVIAIVIDCERRRRVYCYAIW